MKDPKIDTHAHVFQHGLALAAKRRYTPGYEAPLPAYLEQLDRNGLSCGVLVQPSFLGTDNAYLVDCLRRAPQRLRGVAVVAPAGFPGQLPVLHDAGVVGIRLNLVGQCLPDLGGRDWKPLLDEVARLGWHVEVQRNASGLMVMIPQLLDIGAPVVVDHFGLPDPMMGARDPGFQRLLEFGRSRQVWVKLSAPYRLGRYGAHLASSLYPWLRDAFGPERLMWGSDWPHTQFETTQNFDDEYRRFTDLIANDSEVGRILTSPRRLFRF